MTSVSPSPFREWMSLSRRYDFVAPGIWAFRSKGITDLEEEVPPSSSPPLNEPQAPRMSWVGKAHDLAPHLDSVQLQHRISEWRCELPS